MPTLRDPDPSPGAVIAIQTFGDFLNFNPHCQVLCTDGVFYRNGWFKVAQALDTAPLEKVFQHRVLKHLGLWEVKLRPPPRVPKSQSSQNEPHIDYSARPGATFFFVRLIPCATHEVFKKSEGCSV
jgi:hypothetical protein